VVVAFYRAKHEIDINGPRNTRKPWEEKEAHLPDNLGLNIAQKSQQRT
jgi:hypothetical protein